MFRQGYILLTLLCVVLLTQNAAAQYRKMDAAIDRLLQAEPSHRIEASEVFLTLQPEATLPIQRIEELGGSVVMSLSSSRHVISMPTDSIAVLSALNEVKFLELPAASQTLNDQTRSITKAEDVIRGTGIRSPFTGKDVLVGVIDRGFDFNHLAFHDAQGNTRIKCVMVPKNLILNQDSQLYDDLLPFLDDAGYAFIIDDPEYIARLTTDNSDLSHGTHVAGTAAASNCITGIPYGGMAPDANIVLAVCPIADNSNAILAIMSKLLADYAEKEHKPMVVNISLGENSGPHDGTDAIPSTLAEILDDGNRPGLAFVVAAGNEGNIAMGAETEMPFNGLRTFVVPERLNESSFLYWFSAVEAWSEDSTPIDFRYFLYDLQNQQELLTSPFFSHVDYLASGYHSQASYMNDAWDKAGLSRNDFLDRGIIVSLSWGVSASNERFNVNYSISGSMDSTQVIGIEFIAPTSTKTYIYASGKNELSDYGVPGFINGTYTTGYNAYCCTDAIISVGASVSRTQVTNTIGITTEGNDGRPGDVAAFSSWGNSPNGVQIPMVLAPGTMVISPLSYYHDFHESTGLCSSVTTRAYNPGGSHQHQQLWGHLSGTSMAAPAVAGIVAQWMQACPTLTSHQIQEILRASADTAALSDDAAERFGYGQIDAMAGMQYVLNNFCGLRNIQADDPDLPAMMSCPAYDLLGRKTSQSIRTDMPAGIYIVNGRKVVKQ